MSVQVPIGARQGKGVIVIRDVSQFSFHASGWG